MVIISFSYYFHFFFLLIFKARILLRCVIPVVLSNNKNKLLVHMYEGWNFNSGNYLFTNDTK